MELDKEDLLKDLKEDDINSVLHKYDELNSFKLQLEKLTDMLEAKIKIFMKDKRWNTYKADENISVSITKIEQQTIDKDKLKMLLSRQQLESISRFKSIERMVISNKTQREKMKSFINNGKKL